MIRLGTHRQWPHVKRLTGKALCTLSIWEKSVSIDVRARELVATQLSEASKAILNVVDFHSLTAGADREKFDDEVDALVARQWATDQEQLIDRLAEQEGQANPESAKGIGAVVHALQQAQVEVLIFDDQSLADRTLLALGAEPWIATLGRRSPRS